MRRKTYGWTSTFLYNQTINEPQMFFTLICQNIPSGSMVSFSAAANSNSTGAPAPPIELAPTQVNNSSTFTAGVVSAVPVGYSGMISFTLSNKKSFPSGSHVTLQITYPQSSSGSGPQKIILIKEVMTTNA